MSTESVSQRSCPSRLLVIVLESPMHPRVNHYYQAIYPASFLQRTKEPKVLTVILKVEGVLKAY